MTPHLICTCLICGAVWDLGMEPSPCTCPPSTDDDDTVVELAVVPPDRDWRSAVAAVREGLRP